MKSFVKKIGDCKLRMAVEVEAERVERRFQEVVRDFQRTACLPGFREGKAPAEMIEKRFSREVEGEVLKSLIPEAYHQSVETQKVSPVSLPSISDIQVERGRSLKFAAEFERAPQFSLRHYKGIRLKRDSAEVLPEDVEKGLTSLLESRAELVPVLESRAVREGDFIVTDVEVWRDSGYAPPKKGVLLFVEPAAPDDFCEKVVGAQVDEVREIHSQSAPEERQKGLVGPKPHYKVWIRGIKEKRLPALDDGFAQSFGKDTLDELKEALRRDIAGHKHSEIHRRMRSELFEKLLGLASFAVPEGLVEKQKRRLVEQARRECSERGLPESAFEAERLAIEKEAAEKAKDQVRIYFILQKVAELEGIHADETELERRLAALAEKSNRPLDEARRVFEEDLRESLLEAKTVDFLIANAKFEEERK